ncbi:MAG TPA: DUF5995 family protein [Chitinophagaceae bacterium]|nr:DUF5995 family protein [Chitinophagaceae bacterium]
MKKWFLFFPLLYLNSFIANSQAAESEVRLLQMLDSTRKSFSVSKYFADIYFNTTCRAVAFFNKGPKPEKDFIQRLEIRFAFYFFRSAEAYTANDTITEVWRSYYSDSALSPLQYTLLGINAHVNGDIFQALVTEFSADELKKHKSSYSKFNKALVKEYNQFYDKWYNSHHRTQLLHTLSMGMSKFYGRTLLKKWRKRQYKLALWYYQDPDKFKILQQKVRLKRNRIDQLILRQL